LVANTCLFQSVVAKNYFCISLGRTLLILSVWIKIKQNKKQTTYICHIFDHYLGLISMFCNSLVWASILINIFLSCFVVIFQAHCPQHKNSINCKQYFYNIRIEQHFVLKRGGWITMLIFNLFIIDCSLEFFIKKKQITSEIQSLGALYIYHVLDYYLRSIMFLSFLILVSISLFL